MIRCVRPHLGVVHGDHHFDLPMISGSSVSVVDSCFAQEVELPMSPVTPCTPSPEKYGQGEVVGEVHCTFTRNNNILHFDAVVVERLDMNILAGCSFLDINNIILRPARNQIILNDGEIAHYPVKSEMSNSTARSQFNQDTNICNTADQSDTAHVPPAPIIISQKIMNRYFSHLTARPPSTTSAMSTSSQYDFKPNMSSEPRSRRIFLDSNQENSSSVSDESLYPQNPCMKIIFPDVTDDDTDSDYDEEVTAITAVGYEESDEDELDLQLASEKYADTARYYHDELMNVNEAIETSDSDSCEKVNTDGCENDQPFGEKDAYDKVHCRDPVVDLQPIIYCALLGNPTCSDMKDDFEGTSKYKGADQLSTCSALADDNILVTSTTDDGKHHTLKSAGYDTVPHEPTSDAVHGVEEDKNQIMINSNSVHIEQERVSQHMSSDRSHINHDPSPIDCSASRGFFDGIDSTDKNSDDDTHAVDYYQDGLSDDERNHFKACSVSHSQPVIHVALIEDPTCSAVDNYRDNASSRQGVGLDSTMLELADDNRHTATSTAVHEHVTLTNTVYKDHCSSVLHSNMQEDNKNLMPEDYTCHVRIDRINPDLDPLTMDSSDMKGKPCKAPVDPCHKTVASPTEFRSYSIAVSQDSSEVTTSEQAPKYIDTSSCNIGIACRYSTSDCLSDDLVQQVHDFAPSSEYYGEKKRSQGNGEELHTNERNLQVMYGLQKHDHDQLPSYHSRSATIVERKSGSVVLNKFNSTREQTAHQAHQTNKRRYSNVTRSSRQRNARYLNPHSMVPIQPHIVARLHTSESVNVTQTQAFLGIDSTTSQSTDQSAKSRDLDNTCSCVDCMGGPQPYRNADNATTTNMVIINMITSCVPLVPAHWETMHSEKSVNRRKNVKGGQQDEPHLGRPPDPMVNQLQQV